LFKGFVNILMKELKELLRDPKIFLGMIIIPVIMFPLLGAVMNFSVQSALEKVENATIIVLNNDEGNYSKFFINFLNLSLRIIVITNTTPEEVLNSLSKYNTTQFVEIPYGFSKNMTQHIQTPNQDITAFINFYAVFSGSSMFEQIGSSAIDGLVEQFNRNFAPNIVCTEKSAIIKEKIQKGVDPSMLSGLMISQSIAMPITIMILLQVSMQIAATSVAMEKEEKTLETLLSLPMDRFAILMGKLSGSILVAAVGALAYMVGFNYYMGSFTTTIPSEVDLVSLGLAPSLIGYLLLGISLFVALLSALALAVIMSAFAEDVRSAQSMIGFIYPLIFIPSLLLMFLDVNSIPFILRIIIYAIPFSHPVIAAKAVTMGDYLTAFWGIIYVTAFTLVIMYIASRLFATEKILTTKLKFKWLKIRRRTSVEEL